LHVAHDACQVKFEATTTMRFNRNNRIIFQLQSL